MVIFQALTWEARDIDDEHLVSIFGKTQEGKSVCVTTAFTPYFFVKFPKGATQKTAQEIFDVINRKCPECLVSYSVMKAKDVWGFQNNQEFAYMKIDFVNLAMRRRVDYFLKNAIAISSGMVKLKVYESNLDPVLRLMHRTGIQSTGWLHTGDQCVRSYLANVDIDLYCNKWNTLKPVERDDIAPFIVASFDIECNSSTGKFPNANIIGDACFQIAVSLCKFGEDEPFEKVCLCYKKTEGTDVISFDTEREMLEAFQSYVQKKDIDILTGWNIFGFDFQYIHTRAHLVGCNPNFSNSGN